MSGRRLRFTAALLLLAACRAPAHRDAALGPVRWRWRPPPPASVGMPAADAAGVAVTYSHSVVVALTAAGTVRWQARRVGLREEAPLLTTDMVVVPADDGLVAFDRTTGSPRWDARVGGPASTPVVAGHLVVTSVATGALVAVDAGSGAPVWRVPLAGRADGPPATDGATVVATWEPERGDDAGITAVDAGTGKVRWSAPLRAGGVSGAAVVHTAPGRALAVAVDHDLAAKAFDLGTGRRLWSTPVGGAGEPEVPPLTLAGGYVLVADRRAGLRVLDARGRRLWASAGGGAVGRGAPAGPTSGEDYAVVLYDGKLQLGGSGHRRRTVAVPGGLANGVALSPDGVVLVSTAQGDDNQLVAYGPR